MSHSPTFIGIYVGVSTTMYWRYKLRVPDAADTRTFAYVRDCLVHFLHAKVIETFFPSHVDMYDVEVLRGPKPLSLWAYCFTRAGHRRRLREPDGGPVHSVVTEFAHIVPGNLYIVRWW